MCRCGKTKVAVGLRIGVRTGRIGGAMHVRASKPRTYRVGENAVIDEYGYSPWMRHARLTSEREVGGPPRLYVVRILVQLSI